MDEGFNTDRMGDVACLQHSPVSATYLRTNRTAYRHRGERKAGDGKCNEGEECDAQHTNYLGKILNLNLDERRRGVSIW